MEKPFRGGVHPDDSKHTRNEPVRPLEPAGLLILSLSQHIGAPSRPLVSSGDRVLKYQPLATPGGFVSVGLHAPTSGTVKGIEPSPHPSGRFVTAIVLEPDGLDEPMEPAGPGDPNLERGPAAWKEIVRDAGIVGMGGAAFPTHVKLSPPEEKPIEVVVANGVECEPFLTADHRLMVESADVIVSGLALAMEMVGAKKGIVAIEANKPDAAQAMREANLPAGVEVKVLPVMYPQGAEKQLIKALIGREVPTGGLPMDVGAVVQNVGTLAAIDAAVMRGVPLVERVMTLGGTLPNGPGNYMVTLGTPLSHVVENTGGLNGPVSRLINGGPMMGLALSGLESPVTKGTSGLLAFGPGDLRVPRQRACVRCGSCVRVCPASLMPHTLGSLVEWQLFDQLKEFCIGDCIECGCCTFTCPADRNLVQFIRQGKAELLSSGRK
ncbi:MAG: electron transport complex subunit RsxC [bacterium]|nr:electron transport complex subunit RsxC [bacterium]MDT8396200.1 electron transport complex subunit RsxC [bacterium]